MNVFVTSLMHPDTANSYAAVLENFSCTLDSVRRQTDQSLVFIVVCSQLPPRQFHSKNVEFIVVDFPAAERSEIRSKRLDKATKMAVGFAVAARYEPHYIYVVDADDVIHRDLNAFLNANESVFGAGWYVGRGYTVDLISKSVKRKYGLDRFCGSTFALRLDTVLQWKPTLKDLHKNSRQDDIVSSLGEDFLMQALSGHQYHSFSKQSGSSFREVPFPAVVWIRNTGENVLSHQSRPSGGLYNSALERDFGISMSVFGEPPAGILPRISLKLGEFVSWLGWTIDRFRRRIS